MTDLANISVNTMMDMLGPWGRVLQILGEDIEEDNPDDTDLEDNSFLKILKLKKI